MVSGTWTLHLFTRLWQRWIEVSSDNSTMLHVLLQRHDKEWSEWSGLTASMSYAYCLPFTMIVNKQSNNGCNLWCPVVIILWNTYKSIDRGVTKEMKGGVKFIASYMTTISQLTVLVSLVRQSARTLEHAWQE